MINTATCSLFSSMFKMRAIQAKGKRTRRVSFSNLIRGRRAPGDVPTECPGTESCNRAIEAIQGKDSFIELAEFIVESFKGLPQKIEDSGNSESELARGITQEPYTQSEQSTLSWERMELWKWHYLPRNFFRTS